MKGHLNKEGGTVVIDLDVISKYAGLTAIECFGIVGMGMISMKDGLTKLLKRESLTKGVDCSGFVMQVYAHYGISLPHSSSALRGVGRGVSYSEAQPGDIICYSGHVAIYLGGGKIVHASNPKDGIKVSTATYKKILAVRRVM